MKRFLTILALVITILFSTASCIINLDSDDNEYIRIVNETSTREIELVYIKSTGASEWGSDQLGEFETIPGKESLRFPVNSGSYDVQVIDDVRGLFMEEDIYVAGGTTYTLYYNGSSLY